MQATAMPADFWPNHLPELRAADQRLMPNEAAEFLNRVMGLNLSANEAAVLESRAQGRFVGSQLAVLSRVRPQDQHAQAHLARSASYPWAIAATD